MSSRNYTSHLLLEGESPPESGLKRDTHQMEVTQPIVEAPGVLVEKRHREGLSEAGAQEERAAHRPVIRASVRARPGAEGLRLQLADEEGRRQPEQGRPAAIEDEAVAVARRGDEDLTRTQSEVLIAAQVLHEAQSGQIGRASCRERV